MDKVIVCILLIDLACFGAQFQMTISDIMHYITLEMSGGFGLFKTPYNNEREGQIEFFKDFKINTEEGSVLIDNTDGVYNGNLFEFKLNINNLNKVLFQAIKYLSKMRVKGESVPATILLVDLNATTIYVYKSKDYFDQIHRIYSGAASKNNEGFVAQKFNRKLDYSDIVQSSEVRKILKKSNPSEMYMPIDIDENCIVGWAERYYRENPTAKKGDFIGDDTGTAVRITGEIRDPRHFKGLINPYKGESNAKFKYLMDCLNDRLSKKDLGAFYTPPAYARKAAELVQMAVDRVPEGNDYIILDRCAGTGNLEEALIGLTDRNGDSLIGHCVASTYEYYEYKVLQERLGDKLREIIPPTEANVVYESGKVVNADAMSEDFINNPIIKQYVDNPQCTIILFENPPYQDSTAISFTDDNGKRGKASRTGSFVNMAYREISHTLNEGKASAREISNLFIWSAFNYYLKKPEDSYIVISPVKYFKNIGLAKKHFEKGFLFNRKHFHATESSISCILWRNTDDETTEQFLLAAYDIDKEKGNIKYEKDIMIRKSHKTLVEFYDKRTFPDDEKTGVWNAREGVELDKDKKTDVPAIWNKNIIGNLGAPAFSLDAKNRYLIRGSYCHHGVVFNLRSDNYLQKLPLWVAKMYPQDKWYDKDVYNTTSDGGSGYTQDANFLKACLIYTCLSNQNKCLSFDGSNDRRYQNELCFDDSREEKPLALMDLEKYGKTKDAVLDDKEKALIEAWKLVLSEARKTKNYNKEFNYGVYQIDKELNTSHEEVIDKQKKKVYDYPALNGNLETLRVKLKEYYKSHITAKMFEYELIK